MSIQKLYQSLDHRLRPETVASLVLSNLSDVSRKERELLVVAAQYAHRFTSMSEDFARPVMRGLGTAAQLFGVGLPQNKDSAECIRDYIVRADGTIKKAFGENDFLHNRLSRKDRKSAGLDISKRQYNKRFRLLMRLEDGLTRFSRNLQKRAITQVSKSRLASKITFEDFSFDVNTACFIAYFAARCNLRAQFTGWSQVRAFDDICDILFKRCQKSSTTNWFAIAHVYNDQEVLGHLDDCQKGELFSKWFSILNEIALILKELWDRSTIDKTTMIVRQGQDSSTWNTTAGAWNKAREAWIAFVYAMDMEEVIDRMCPGKVLRLMAADVAHWHRSTTGGLEPDTAVWNDLPLPWEVLSGEKDCSRQYVEDVCHKYGVDSDQKNWTKPRPKGKPVQFTPTPELVHGVTVGNPALALLLRKLGFFSGKCVTVGA